MQNKGFETRPDDRVTFCAGHDRPAYLDYEDAVKLMSVHMRFDGRYLRIKNFKIHRVIMKAPKGMVIHHKDGDPFLNQKYNLEIVKQTIHAQRHSIKNKRFGFYKVRGKFKTQISGGKNGN